MQVVGHDAIGIHHELMEDRFGSKAIYDPGCLSGVGKNRFATLTAHRHEVPFFAAIFLWRKVTRAWCGIHVSSEPIT
jgi:hypothetical protein